MSEQVNNCETFGLVSDSFITICVFINHNLCVYSSSLVLEGEHIFKAGNTKRTMSTVIDGSNVGTVEESRFQTCDLVRSSS